MEKIGSQPKRRIKNSWAGILRSTITGVLALQVTPCFAQSLQVSGPQIAHAGESMVFSLLSGSQTLTADLWQQGLNPDKYTGNDYVTSFTLAFSANSDGSETIVAPAPGRYLILAYSGGQVYQAYVLVQPVTPLPAIRGAVLALFSALTDKQYALNVMAAGRQAGLTWINISAIGCMDIDSGNLTVQIFPPPSPCVFGFPISDLEWVIDQAHQLGYKVAVTPAVYAEYQGTAAELQLFFAPTFPPPPPFPPILDVFSAFTQWTLTVAAVAQAHNADAMFIGQQWQDYDSTVDQELDPLWVAWIGQIRSEFSGSLSLGWEFPCAPAFSFAHWNLLDSIYFVESIAGSEPSCGGGTPSTFPTAGEMLPYYQNTQSLYAFQLQASTGLPMLWDLYTSNHDGVNYMSELPSFSIAPVDNQEIVDVFEAVMQAKSALPSQMAGMVLEGASIFAGSGNDLASQPPLFAAVANWFGGDVSYFAPCFSSPLTNVIYSNDFEPSRCPLPAGGATGAPFGALTLDPSDFGSIVADPSDPSNHIFRFPDTGGYAAYSGDASWTDYAASFQFRIFEQDAIPNIFFRQSPAGQYNIQVMVTQARLYKNNALITTYQIPGGLPLNVWNTFSVTVAGASINFALNGVTAIRYTDTTDPILTGGVALTTCCSTGSGPYDFDNFLVTVPAVPMPVCTYTNSLATLSIPGSGGTGIVHVTANDPRCSWTAAAGQNWTTITSGSYSAGSVPVLFTVGPNPSNTPRTGTIAIAGQPLTINQAPGTSHPAFFTGEAPLADSVYYLAFPDSNLFGYYSYLAGGFVYHFDMGYEYVDPGTGSTMYFWDLSSGHWWYTSSSLFPYLYDFTLSQWIYYFPANNDPGHYSSAPRYFAIPATNQIITM